MPEGRKRQWRINIWSNNGLELFKINDRYQIIDPGDSEETKQHKEKINKQRDNAPPPNTQLGIIYLNCRKLKTNGNLERNQREKKSLAYRGSRMSNSKLFIKNHTNKKRVKWHTISVSYGQNVCVSSQFLFYDPNPLVRIGDGASKKVIKIKWGHKCGDLIQ